MYIKIHRMMIILKWIGEQMRAARLSFFIGIISTYIHILQVISAYAITS
jgi:hypothetical protein